MTIPVRTIAAVRRIINHIFNNVENPVPFTDRVFLAKLNAMHYNEQKPEVMAYMPGPWFAVNYGGFWTLQDSQGYEPDSDILVEDSTPYAVPNAYLAAAAPDMMAALQEAFNVLYDPNRGHTRSLDTFVELAIKAFRKAKVKPEIF